MGKYFKYFDQMMLSTTSFLPKKEKKKSFYYLIISSYMNFYPSTQLLLYSMLNSFLAFVRPYNDIKDLVLRLK